MFALPRLCGLTGTGVIGPPRKEPLNGTLSGGQQERGHWIVFAFLQSNPQEQLCQNMSKYLKIMQ